MDLISGLHFFVSVSGLANYLLFVSVSVSGLADLISGLHFFGSVSVSGLADLISGLNFLF